MFKNYFTIALRVFSKSKLYTFINVFGLSIGFSSFLLVALWVYDESTIDSFHENSDRIYKVIAGISANGDVNYWDNSPGLLAELALEEVSGIRNATKVPPTIDRLFVIEDQKSMEYGKYVSPGFLEMFTFPLLHGDVTTALSQLNSIVISRKLAEKYFPNEIALGKDIILLEEGVRQSYTVTGVLEDIPSNSTLIFDFLLPFEKYLSLYPWNKNWNNYNNETYLQLENNVSAEEISALLTEQFRKRADTEATTLHLYPFKDYYLYANISGGLDAEGRIKYVKIFSLVGIIVLIIACINFINLTVARAGIRVKEIGMRKVVGATKSKIVRQFLVESVLTAFLSLILALLFITLFLPTFNFIVGKSLVLPYDNILFWVFSISIVFIIGLLAGFYPAFYLSGIGAVELFSASKYNSKSSWDLKKILVIVQFTASFVFIVASTFVHLQLDYMLGKDLGLNKTGIITHPRHGAIAKKYQAYATSLTDLPGVESVSFANFNPLKIDNTTSSIQWEGKQDEQIVYFHVIQVSKDFLKTFDLKLIEGNDFSQYADTLTNYVIINKTAALAMGMEHPIGETITLWGKERTIVGLIDDFHHASLDSPIEPVILFFNPINGWSTFIKLKHENTPSTLESIEKVHATIEDQYPFTYEFLEDKYSGQYTTIKRIGSLTAFFAILAIFISILGLLALAAFLTNEKSKEVSIRKVLGANYIQLISLISTDFMKLIFISLIIGVPCSWYLVSNWIDGFAFKLELTLLPFTIASGFILCLSFLIVVYHILVIANRNPSEVLRQQ